MTAADVTGGLRQGIDGVCARLGLEPGSATLIRFTMNAVFTAGPYVLRLNQGPDAGDRARQVIAVAAALARAGAPTIRPADVPGNPILNGRWVATVWHREPVTGAGATPADLARPLRDLHAVPDLPLPLPRWSPVTRMRRRLSDAESADGLHAWSARELGLPGPELVARLRARCDAIEERLSGVTWRLEPGTIHADAHTGNVLMRPGGAPALLCDLDGVCVGPREWDLVPTAHRVARFGRPAAAYRAFAEAYGFDVTACDGWPVLRELRDLQLVAGVLATAADRPDRTSELAHRTRSYLARDSTAIWTRFG